MNTTPEHELPLQEGEVTNRRDWITGLARTSALTGLGAVSLSLFARNVNAACIQTGSPCDACQLYDGCELPRADESRTNHAPESRRSGASPVETNGGS